MEPHRTCSYGKDQVFRDIALHQSFLAAVGTTTKEKCVYLLKYVNGQFRTYYNVKIDSRAYGIKHMRHGADHVFIHCFRRYHPVTHATSPQSIHGQLQVKFFCQRRSIRCFIERRKGFGILKKSLL